MRLVIDCFKLVKGKGKSIGIYNLAQSLVQHLTATNKSGEHCEEIIVLGNEYNRKDFDIPGIRCFKPISQHGPQSQPGIIRIKKGDEGLRLNLMFDFR